MSYLMDFLFGFLGFFVGWLVYELGKAELVKCGWKDLKRPKPVPGINPKTPGRKMSVADILAEARKNNEHTGERVS